MQRDDLQRKLLEEARFQDERVRAQAAGHDEARGRFYYLTEPALEHYEHLLYEDIRGKSVLIVGCSVGGVPPLVRFGANATGIDISPEAIQRLNEHIQRLGISGQGRALVMNAEDLDFPPASFDVICCSGVLHHLDTEKAARSWAAALKPGGRAVLMEPLAGHPAVAVYRSLTPHMRTRDEHPLKPKDFQILRRHFGEVDFTGYALTSVLSLPFAYLGLPRMRDLTCRALNALDRAILTLFPPLRHLCWTSVIELRKPRPGTPANRV